MQERVGRNNLTMRSHEMTRSNRFDLFMSFRVASWFKILRCHTATRSADVRAAPRRLTARGQQCDHASPHKNFCRHHLREAIVMEIDRDKIVTQEETGELPAVDQVEGRVESEMKRIEGRAKEGVAQGLQNKELEREGQELQEEGERELEEQ